MTDFRTLLYTQLVKSLPFLYLKPEKGTPFRRSLPVEAIIGSTPPHPPGPKTIRLLHLAILAS